MKRIPILVALALIAGPASAQQEFNTSNTGGYGQAPPQDQWRGQQGSPGYGASGETNRSGGGWQTQPESGWQGTGSGNLDAQNPPVQSQPQYQNQPQVQGPAFENPPGQQLQDQPQGFENEGEGNVNLNAGNQGQFQTTPQPSADALRQEAQNDLQRSHELLQESRNELQQSRERLNGVQGTGSASPNTESPAQQQFRSQPRRVIP